PAIDQISNGCCRGCREWVFVQTDTLLQRDAPRHSQSAPHDSRRNKEYPGPRPRGGRHRHRRSNNSVPEPAPACPDVPRDGAGSRAAWSARLRYGPQRGAWLQRWKNPHRRTWLRQWFERTFWSNKQETVRSTVCTNYR